MAQRFPRPLGFSRAREPSHSGNGELWPAGLALPLGSSPFPPGTPACLPGFAPGPCSGEAFPGVGGMDEPYEPSGARVWPLQAPGEAEDSPWGPPSGPPGRAHLPARLHLLFVAGPSPQVNSPGFPGNHAGGRPRASCLTRTARAGGEGLGAVVVRGLSLEDGVGTRAWPPLPPLLTSLAWLLIS